MARVFLSYDHDDFAPAKALAKAIEGAGHIVWYDRHIHGGAQFSQKIEQALDAADAVIVLWSPRSLESAWVRDEAAEGRDRQKLIPLSVDMVTPPMGFRQFQTIALGSWKGRGRVPKLDQILDAIANQSLGEPTDGIAPSGVGATIAAPSTPRRMTRWLTIAVLLIMVGAAGWLGWSRFGGSSLTKIEVEAADSSPGSQGAARDLFVKLGSLAVVGEGKWQLIEASDSTSEPDLMFKAADTGSAAEPRASLLLLDKKNNALLWSREFGGAGTRVAILRQQMALTAGRVLACALETRNGALDRQLVKTFLGACASMAEVGWDKRPVVQALRQIVTASPRFAPGWARLLTAEIDAVQYGTNGATVQDSDIRQLKQDIASARAIDGDMPEVALADFWLSKMPPVAPVMTLIDKAVSAHPNNAALLGAQAGLLATVGRMTESIDAYKRAMGLDPLSPEARGAYILALAYGGQIDVAWAELAKAKRDFPEAETIEQTQLSLDLRYGDAAKFLSSANQNEGAPLYLAMRNNPSAENVDRLFAIFKPGLTHSDISFGLQAMAEVGRADKAFELLALPTSEPLLTADSYLFFRSYTKALRNDPRFMTLAKKLGLVAYWQQSGRWPDFCTDALPPYDCKAEVAKLGP